MTERPWRWYCRLCGATGLHASAEERNARAFGHLKTGPCGQYLMIGRAEFGKLLHVWTFAAEEPKGAFPVVVIYRNPSDFPGKYVVRRQWALPGAIDIEFRALAVVDTLDQARDAVPANHDLCITRQSSDDPNIVESWI